MFLFLTSAIIFFAIRAQYFPKEDLGLAIVVYSAITILVARLYMLSRVEAHLRDAKKRKSEYERNYGPLKPGSRTASAATKLGAAAISQIGAPPVAVALGAIAWDIGKEWLSARPDPQMAKIKKKINEEIDSAAWVEVKFYSFLLTHVAVVYVFWDSWK